MKNQAYFLFVFLFITGVKLLDAADKLSISLYGGPAFVTGPDITSEIIPYSLSFSADLIYQVHPNVGIIPISFTFKRFDVDEKEFGSYLKYLGIDAISEASLRTFSFVPGVHFNTSYKRKIRIFAQAGAGFTHAKTSLEVIISDALFDQGGVSRDLTFYYGGGIEAELSSKASLVGRIRYYYHLDVEKYLHVDNTYSWGIEFNGGVKIFF